MRANKRVRDLDRKSNFRLTAIVDGVKVGVTTFPWSRADKKGKQEKNGVRFEVRE